VDATRLFVHYELAELLKLQGTTSFFQASRARGVSALKAHRKGRANDWGGAIRWAQHDAAAEIRALCPNHRSGVSSRGDAPSSPNFEGVLRFGLGLEMPQGDKLESRRHWGIRFSTSITGHDV
jgi:hypothetical protein